MDISLYCDTVSPSSRAKQPLGFSSTKLLIRQHLTAESIIAMARPPVKSRPRKTRIRKLRRTRPRLAGGDDVFGGSIEGFTGGGDDGGYDGNFGGNGAGGGGRWNFEGENWGDEEDGWSGFAAGFIYEVLGWIALSNCVHFAFKKFVRSVTDGIANAEQGKVPDQLGSVC